MDKTAVSSEAPLEEITLMIDAQISKHTEARLMTIEAKLDTVLEWIASVNEQASQFQGMIETAMESPMIQALVGNVGSEFGFPTA